MTSRRPGVVLSPVFPTLNFRGPRISCIAYPRSCGTSDQQPRDSGCKNHSHIRAMNTQVRSTCLPSSSRPAGRSVGSIAAGTRTRRQGVSVGKSRCGVQVRPTSLAETYSQYVEELRPRARLIAVMEALRLLALGQCRGLHHTAQVSVRQLDQIRD